MTKTKLLFLSLTAFMMGGALVVGCEGEPQQIAPAVSGSRNDSCTAKNDCADGFSCINETCTPTDFSIQSTGMECYRIDCSDTADCCGDRPTEAPAKCNERETKCEPYLPGCMPFEDCSADSECGAGSCDIAGSCTESFASCSADGDCAANTCDIGNGYCVVSFDFCTGNEDCSANTCDLPTSGSCDCSNPDYDPGDAICDDEDCDDICNFVCEDEQCRLDTSCEDDNDCGADFCVEGSCVECRADEEDDCEVDDGESCVSGECIKPCEYNEECGSFEACDTDSGECEYVGCSSDRECVLSMSGYSSEDSRLLECRDSSLPGIKTCQLPCENDGHCRESETCDAGYCKYLGCESSAECKAILGLDNEETSDSKPWITRGVCRDPEAAE